MCVLCGATQVPVCTTAGPCLAGIQQILGFALMIGGATLVSARAWFASAAARVRTPRASI